LAYACPLLQALLQSSHLYAEAQHSFKKHGVLVEGVSVDVAAMQQQKTSAVDGLTKGIEGLFKKNKVRLWRACAHPHAVLAGACCDSLWHRKLREGAAAGSLLAALSSRRNPCTPVSWPAAAAGRVCQGLGQAEERHRGGGQYRRRHHHHPCDQEHHHRHRIGGHAPARRARRRAPVRRVGKPSMR
jgi:hypothetical protein